MLNYLCILDECLYFSIHDATDILQESYQEFSTLVDILTYNAIKDNLYVCLTHMMFHYCGDYKVCIKDENNCCRLTGKYITNGIDKQTVPLVQPTLIPQNTTKDIVIDKFNQHYFFQYVVDILQENNVNVQESDSLMALIVHLYELFQQRLHQDELKQRTTVENRLKLAKSRLYNIINVILEYNLETKIYTQVEDNKFLKSVYLMVSAYLVQGTNIHLSKQKSDLLKQWITRQKKFKWL